MAAAGVVAAAAAVTGVAPRPVPAASSALRRTVQLGSSTSQQNLSVESSHRRGALVCRFGLPAKNSVATCLLARQRTFYRLLCAMLLCLKAAL